MSRTVKANQNARAADDYLALVIRFPLHPIRTQADYRRALAILKDLVGRADDGLTPAESDYADVLRQLVRDFDQRHSTLLKQKAAGPIESLKYLMAEHGMNTISLGKLVGGSGHASLILSGKRELSKANIRALAARFQVSPALFL